MARGGGCVVTVGTYDGVHLGHRRLLAESLAEGARLQLPTVVVTFDRHPAEVLRPEHAPKLLTGLEHKLELLSETGVDDLVVLHFDLEHARESAEDFVASYLLGELGAVSVLVGSNFRFGHRQRGDVTLLAELARSRGFSARGIDLVIDDATRSVVSSSAIRRHLADGRVREAMRLLGRPHEVRGARAGGSVEVASALCLPAPGPYDALVGSIGAPFASCRVVVAEAPGGSTRTIELEESPSERLGATPGLSAVRFVARIGGEAESPTALASRPEADR